MSWRQLLLPLLVAVCYFTSTHAVSGLTTVVTVSAASFELTAVAPDAIAAAFGSQLANQVASGTDTDPVAPGIQLPTRLAGTSLEVNGRLASLLFVSPGQINFVVPSQTEAGAANVVVRDTGGVIASGSVQAAQVSPGVFTANSDGTGVAAALAFRLRADQSFSYEQVARFDAGLNRFVATPIDLGPPDERVFLIAFATGLRRASDPNGDGNLNENVRVLLGGEELAPAYAGRQADFVGLEQINVELQRTLIGRGQISFAIAAPGAVTSNQAQIVIAGQAGSSSPQVNGFGTGSALAGQSLTINGSGFYSGPAQNTVRINGVEATVMTASATQLTIVVPFGAETGTVSVRTPTGEGTSSGPLQVRTSISGFVENTERQPLSGVRVRLVGTTILAQTTSEGSFVLPDVPTGTQYVDVDGEALPTTPPYPKITLKTIAFANRDNQFSRPVALQQSTGGSAAVGSGGSFTESPGGGVSWNQQIDQQLQPTPIDTAGFSLLLPANVDAVFPGGSRNGTLFLTPIKDGRTPVELPAGIFSTSIVQIAPFDVQISPGAKLSFPNSDGLPAGSLAKLFRYESVEGKFIEDPAGATVSSNGQRVETASTAIKKATYYFVARPGLNATLTGRVLEKDGVTPVRRALISVRGQETSTDGNGGYVLRFVPVKNEDFVGIEVSVLRPNGRVDRAKSSLIRAIPNATSKAPDILLSSATENRLPVILGPLTYAMAESATAELGVVVTDPDVTQTPQVTLSGPSFATLVPIFPGSPPVFPTGTILRFLIRLTPGFKDAGEYTLVVTAVDDAGGRSTAAITLVVRNVNRPPVTSNQSVVLDEDTSIEITLPVTDADDDHLLLLPVNSPAHGTLSAAFQKKVTYTPAPDYVGNDAFSYKMFDGTSESNTATVSLTIRPVNDPPRIVLPLAQSVREGQKLTFVVSVSDPDIGQLVDLTGLNLPLGAVLEAQSSSTALFTWIPGFVQAGTHTIAFKATDNGSPPLSVIQDVDVTVYDTRRELAVEAADATFVNPNTASVAAGDVNGDLIADLVIGAPLSKVSGSEAGRVFVYFGHAGLGRTLGPAVLPDVTISGDQSGDRFGASVAVGDLNGDGKGDLVVGAPGAGGSGRVYVISGELSFGEFKGAERSRLIVRGVAAGDELGAKVTVGRLRKESGPQDLIIGAPKALSEAGAAYVLFGGSSLSGLRNLQTSDADLTLLGVAVGGELGSSLAAGDYNGDKIDDLAVGAPYANLSFKGQGIVYVVTGYAELKGKVNVTQAALLQLNGRDVGDNFGYTVAFGNLNGDGRADLIVGAPGGDGPTNLRPAAGEVSVFFGRNGAELGGPLLPSMIIYGATTAPGTLGVSVAVGDITGDGIDDLAMSAPSLGGPNLPSTPPGAVYVLFGSSTGFSPAIDLASRAADLTVFGARPTDRLGIGGLAIGNINASFPADLVIGAPTEVYVLFGVRRQ